MFVNCQVFGNESPNPHPHPPLIWSQINSCIYWSLQPLLDRQSLSRLYGIKTWLWGIAGVAEGPVRWSVSRLQPLGVPQIPQMWVAEQRNELAIQWTRWHQRVEECGAGSVFSHFTVLTVRRKTPTHPSSSPFSSSSTQWVIRHPPSCRGSVRIYWTAQVSSLS